MEDRGTRYYLFNDPDAIVSFENPWDKRLYAVISVPIGWSLRPDDCYGVVLQNVFGVKLDANRALVAATEGTYGFRVITDDPCGDGTAGLGQDSLRPPAGQ